MSGVGITIRPIRPEECEAAGELVVAAYRALEGGHSSPEYDRELRDVARRANEAHVLIAVEGELAGCVTLVPDSSSPWAERLEEGEAGVRMLAVAPNRQGEGIGRALLDQCISLARSWERDALVLHSTPWMEVAHHLYETCGFVRTPERDFRPVPDVPLLAFRLALTGS